MSGVDGGLAVGSSPRALVCFSHLRWDFVWQRPQHLFSRFAGAWPVYVVEEPEFGATLGELRERRDHGVTIVTPVLPAVFEPHWGFNSTTNPHIRRLLTPYFAARGLLDPSPGGVIAWYYTPMALGAEPENLATALVVFDAMDELANFRGAPLELRQQEAALMTRADLVFAGGPSLYAARKHRHHAVHCFPSGVDPDHFAQAGNGIARPADLSGQPSPILGFYGVLDERVDFDLVAAVADARPDWTLAMVGPLAKIDEADLPRRPNIAYYGKRSYDDLPAYLAGFDVALLPFARNEATRFISPTKTLEYMAGEKPIVSTPIKDVVDLYGEVVAFGATPVEFIAAVERTLAETPAARIRRLTASRRILAQHTWDAISEGMVGLMVQALARREDVLVARSDQRLPRPAADVRGYAATALDRRQPTPLVTADAVALASAAVGED